MDENSFSFERLEVYNKALNFINTIFSISNKFPNKLQYSLGDQLRRASLSIANNLAEGSDKGSAKNKRQLYGYALDSARECIPMLTVCFKQDLISKNEHSRLRDDCTIICKMLRKLIQSVL